MDNITPLGLGFTLTMGVLLLLLPRRLALIPVLMLTCYMTLGQFIVIAGLHFYTLRILALFGWLRLLRGEARGFEFNKVDTAFLWWVFWMFTIYTLQWRSLEATIYKSGFAYDAINLYFICRVLIRNQEDVRRTFKVASLLIVPLAAAMLAEKLTGRNLFAMFGGVLEITRIRDEVLRCQGPFQHPILAGTFGAALLPFSIELIWQRRGAKLIGVLGVISSTIITFTSGSSGPVLAWAAALVGFSFWKFRLKMRAVRWGLVIMLALLQCFMKVPIWFLIAKVGIFSGSTSYHRAFLIDRAIAHFGEWFLLGTRSTEHWGPFLADITNMYVRQGVDGGLITLIAFILVMKRCLSGIGLALRASENQSLESQKVLWTTGVALLVHLSSMISINYFDQNIVILYLSLAAISSLTGKYLSHPKPRAATVGPEHRNSQFGFGNWGSMQSQASETKP